MIELCSPRTDPETLKTQIDWLNDPELMRYSDQRHRKHNIGSQLEYVLSFLEHPRNILREIHVNGAMVGTISAYIDTYNRIANVGILLARESWGQGHGYEAWASLCNTLFDTVGMRRIEAGCMATNAPMINLMRRFGMREEGRRVGHFIVSDSYSDLVLYGRFK